MHTALKNAFASASIQQRLAFRTIEVLREHSRELDDILRLLVDRGVNIIYVGATENRMDWVPGDPPVRIAASFVGSDLTPPSVLAGFFNSPVRRNDSDTFVDVYPARIVIY